MRLNGASAVWVFGLLLLCALSDRAQTSVAQQLVTVPAQTVCGANGYRVVAQRWDAVLGRNWELRQDCSHPAWPARSFAIASTNVSSIPRNQSIRSNEVVSIVLPLLMHAGDRVRLWMQNETVRIEMSGVVEQSAHSGERVTVQVTRQDADSGMSIERFSGIVRGTEDVEMEQ